MAGIYIKTPEQIEGIRKASKLAAEVLDYIEPFVKPGISTGELDKLCHEFITDHNAIPAPLNYCPHGSTPYPKATCISLNEVVCHGIPNFNKKLKKGDALNIDITVILDGYYGDTSRMYFAGEPSIMARRLANITYQSMWLGIREVKPGNHFGDIGYVIQHFAENAGYSVVREFCGHGVGIEFHEEPQVLHYGRRGTGEEIKPGMIFTIEPMINVGKRAITQLNDGWTVRTKDRSLSAQWEHTILVTDTGYEILTVSPNMPAPPKFITEGK
ncbi:MAG: type I methionyl aminopeptidase [Oxalobacter sp.]|nr:type I methionyl aminopeptidase [Oxalobacter sp.]